MFQKENKLIIGEVRSTKIAEKFGTPVYVYDIEKIRRQYDRLSEAFNSRYENFSINYAVKANNNPYIVEKLVKKGAGLDCASKAELKLAENLGANDIIYTAPFNTEEQVNYAIELGSTLNLDSMFLMDKIEDFPETICFRIDPGMGKGDHGLKFGGGDTKFGIPEDKAVEAYRRAKERGAKNFGIHMMTGSNIRDPEYFGDITQKLLEIAGKISEEVGIDFEFVDIGGGLGIAYSDDQEELDIERTAEITVEKFRKGIENYDIGDPTLKIEPGRYLVCKSGIILTKVTGKKEKGGKTYIGVDTGMHQILRPMLLDAYHEIILANDLNRKTIEKVDIVGPTCTTVDLIAQDREMPEITEGNLLAIMDVGAYGYSMASNWNSRPLPAEIAVENSEMKKIREAQDFEDVFHGTDYEV